MKLHRRKSEFDYTIDYSKLDLRNNPELYRIGRGEQGVLLVEPYKSEILPYWKFKTPSIAKVSAAKIYSLYLGYKKVNDFIGMDMARKFIQMGYTRSRRYANHSGGRKYKQGTKIVLPYNEDLKKAASAKIFYAFWMRIREDRDYLKLKNDWNKKQFPAAVANASSKCPPTP